MVFQVNNVYANKKIVTKTVTFFILVLTLSLLLVQLSPVNAQDPGASLTGTITNEGIDLDDDGHFDVLRVGIEVNVTTPGTYTVDAGGLYDGVPNVAYVQDNATEYLTVGLHFLYVDLDGTKIYAGNVSPTHLASVYLIDNTDTTIDQKADLALPTSYTFDDFQRPVLNIEIEKIQREITVEQSGKILVSNAYTINNLGFMAENLTIGIPENAKDVKVRDEMGTLETSIDDTMMTVSLRSILDTNQTGTLYVSYYLPWNEHITNPNGNDYTLSSTFYENFNSTIGTLTVSVTLPDGATYQSSTLNPDSVQKNGPETMTFLFTDVNPSDNLTFEINYQYSVFWASLYPTIWVGIIAVIGTAVYFVWGKPQQGISAPTVQVPTKDLTNFVNTYDEKTSIKSELASLEERQQKGKIPRRKYKVRKKMLEGRLSAVSRSLSTLGASIRAGGSKYERLMSDLEIAEAKLENVEKDLQRVKARHNRGEISKGAYEKLLEEYQNRIEDAESTIDGVLLRLRD